MRVGLDLDGTIYHWTKAAAEWLNAFVGEEKWDPLVDPPEWGHFKKVFGPEAWNALWNKDNVHEVFNLAELYEGAVKFVETLFNRGYDVRVITSRPEVVRYYTLTNWFADFYNVAGTPIPSFFFSPLRRVAAKAELDVDVYIDDHPYADDLWKLTGKPVILFDRPYNQNAGPVGIIRVTNYTEALKELSEMEEE